MNVASAPVDLDAGTSRLNARSLRGFLAATNCRRRQAHPASARQKPACAGEDDRGYRYQVEQGGNDGTRLSVGDFKEAGVIVAADNGALERQKP
jgi:hypothetical protein